MASRKFLIEGIMKLAQKIGANPSKFMGTKTNINFLGTGDKSMKGTTFGGQLRDDFLEVGVSRDDLIKIIEQDAGYVTANKLNDVQLKTMYDNLVMVDGKLNPVSPTNVFDMATGTGDLNKKGLESLRGTTPLTDKISEGITSIKRKRPEFKDTPAQALDRGFMEAEGARRAVLRQALLKDENALKSLPEGVVDSLKYSRDLQGIENRSNDPLILFRGIYGDTVDFNKIDEIIANEPFGDANSIADKVLAFMKQGDNFAEGGRIGYRSGRSVKGILDLIRSRFGKDAITTADDMKLSDSVLTRKMFADFNKRNKKATADELVDPNVTLEKALDEVGGNFASGDMKYNADILADELAFQRGLIKEGEDITYIADQATRSKLYNEAYSALSAQFLKLRNMKKQAAIDISDPRVAEDFTNFIKKNDPKSYKELEQKVDLMNFDPTGRKKNAKGGLAKILEV
jgi:hypothetical protein